MAGRGLRTGAIPPLPVGYDWLIKGRVAAGGHPARSGDPAAYLKALSLLGFNAILTLTEDSLPSSALSEFGYRSLHLPIPETAAPSAAQADQAVEFISTCLEAGLQLYVHCYAGYGRTGAVLAAYLVSTGLGPFAAIQQMRAARPGAVESPQQERFVIEYSRRFAAKRRPS